MKLKDAQLAAAAAAAYSATDPYRDLGHYRWMLAKTVEVASDTGEQSVFVRAPERLWPLLLEDAHAAGYRTEVQRDKRRDWRNGIILYWGAAQPSSPTSTKKWWWPW